MEKIWQVIEDASVAGTEISLYSLTLSLLLAFVLGQLLAWTYYFTHSGLSYSRAFVQSLVIITVIVSMVMSTIAGSFVIAVGLMGALSIIRFRNIIKDTRDIAFIFSALVIGMAAGSQRYIIAIVGALSICIIIVYLHFSEFGSHRPHNAFLKFRFSGYIDSRHPIVKILKKFCGNYALISSQGGDPDNAMVEYAYQVMLKNVTKNEQMLSELHNIEGIQNVNLTVQEQLLQI